MNHKTSHLVLGTAQFGSNYGVFNKDSNISTPEMEAMLRIAAEHGVTTLDTAPAYGNAEQRLGQFDLSLFSLVTKLVCPLSDKGYQSFDPEQLLTISLQNLGINKVEAVLIHNTHNLNDDQVKMVLGQLSRLKEQGLCNKIGVSVYNPKDVMRLAADNDIDVVQLPTNAIDQRLADDGILAFAQHHSIDLHIRSIFMQGLLLNNYEDLPTYFLPWEAQFKSWAKWLHTHQMSPLEGAFSCVNSYFARGINKIIFGANSSEQLKDLISKSSTPAKSPSSAYRSDDLNLIHPYNWVLK